MLAILAGCDSPTPRARVQNVVEISIDEYGHCRLDHQVVPCDSMGPALRARYPASNPEVQVCPSKRSNYSPAAALIRSLQDSGFPRLGFQCAG